MLKTGQRAYWTVSAAGIHVLDPNAKNRAGDRVLPVASQPSKVVKLPGQPGSDVGAGGPGLSPDGRWILYLHRDQSEARIMLENFR